MCKIKILSLTLAASGALTLATMADDATTKPAPAEVKPAGAEVKPAAPAAKTSTNDAKAVRPGAQKQADMASKTAQFGKVAKTDAAYKSAIEAHLLDDAKKLVDKEGGFKGTVAKLYERGGIAIVEFDNDYKSALTAVVRGSSFDKFPALTNLIGKGVLVTGKFSKYHDAAQIVVEKPEQIKVVEAGK